MHAEYISALSATKASASGWQSKIGAADQIEIHSAASSANRLMLGTLKHFVNVQGAQGILGSITQHHHPKDLACQRGCEGVETQRDDLGIAQAKEDYYGAPYLDTDDGTVSKKKRVSDSRENITAQTHP